MMAWSRITRRVLGVFWITFTTLLVQVSASGIFELDLESFRNDQGLDENGDCCSGIHSPQNGQCTQTCRTFFKVCLKEYQAHINYDPPCTFGSMTTPVIGDNSFTFPDTIHSFSNPIQMPFEFTWPGDFTLIISVWHDSTGSGPQPGSPREMISQMATQEAVGVGETWNQKVYTTTSSELKYSYRVICDENYYGDKCADYCKPRDDSFGHYTCLEGRRVCLDGWSGTYCDLSICLPGCHAENGYCTRPNECRCRIGWKGEMCNECVPYPGCDHGTCTESWECKCLEGWGGLFCNQDLNYCTHYEPCKNGATCMNTGQGGYTCACRVGFTGTNCEIEIDDCQHRPCLNGGICTDTGKDYTCRCPLGFHGRHCESSATSCEENPCKNSGVCSDMPDSGYRCSCRPGYTGVNCEQEINECASHPCLNGGRCVDDLDGYHCVCRAGYSGDRCQDNPNDCTLDPCQNGGTCLDRVNDFECRCVSGFVGRLCETNVNDCEMSPCANGGSCQDLVNDFICVCAKGFAGKDCHINIDDCQSHPCANGATCRDKVDDYECNCQPGFYGKKCEFIEGQATPKPPVRTSTTVANSEQSTTELDANASKNTGEEAQPVLTVPQLLLIVCLGIGIPIIVIVVIIIFIVCNRRRNNRDNTVIKDNEQNEIANMNNKNKNNENIIDNLSTLPAPQTLKVTNEDLSCHQQHKLGSLSCEPSGSGGTSYSNTANTRHQLNVDKPYTVNKNYLKDNIYKSARTKNQLMDYPQDRGRHIVQDRGQHLAVEASLSDARGHHPVVEPSLSEASDYSSADLHHIVKSLSTEPHQGSIFYLDPHCSSQQSRYREAMLATEV